MDLRESPAGGRGPAALAGAGEKLAALPKGDDRFHKIAEMIDAVALNLWPGSYRSTSTILL